MTTITTYGATQLVNHWFKELGIDKVLPQPMIYNYTTAKIRRGEKPMIELNANNELTIESLTEWFGTKYLVRNFKGYVTKFEEMNSNQDQLDLK